MARPKTDMTPPPTDQEILAYDNVPVEVAAKYIGSSTATLYRALREERVPFGWAVEHKGGQWSHNISPGALVKYKHGELPMYKLREVQELAADGIERILDERMGALKKMAAAVLG